MVETEGTTEIDGIVETEGAMEMDGANVGEGVSCTYHTQFTNPKYF